jgi:hypothetical protein
MLSRDHIWVVLLLFTFVAIFLLFIVFLVIILIVESLAYEILDGTGYYSLAGVVAEL